jgi:hypothetical protein
MYRLLQALEYEILDYNKLIGEVEWEILRERMMNFFHKTGSTDTLLFYFSGHGVPDQYGDTYLATSDIDPDNPMYKGVPFGELTVVIT